MKKLTCKELGGTCDEEITGESFAEVGEKCHAHVVEQIEKGDEAHRSAAEQMKNATPEEREAMMALYQRRFNEAKEV